MFENDSDILLQENDIKNCKYICDTISQGKITLEFLKQTASGVSAQTLAEVVILLKGIGKSPDQLNELVSGNNLPVYDVVGTGGTGECRLNISSLVTLFAPQFGLSVIKHGGRSSVGKMGSNDFVESLGISLEKMHAFAPEYYRASGILFLTAAYIHPVFVKSASLRKQLGTPTLFNLLGPLLNPVHIKGKVIGAYNRDVSELLAKTCQYLNEVAIIVSSQDKEGFLDEASPFALTSLYFCKDKKIYSFSLEPIENLAWARSHLFLDPIKAANNLLSLKKCKETEVAKKLIAYNLALLCILHEFVAVEEVTLEKFFDNLSLKIKNLYALILSNFDVYVGQVKERISLLVNLQPLHKKSPVYSQTDNSSMPCTQFNFSNMFSGSHVHSSHAKTVASSKKDHNQSQDADNLFIAEIKLASPYKEFHSLLSLQERLKAYEKADAISVVTHSAFSGSLGLLREVRKLTTKPILAKDVVRTNAEIVALKEAGANGILLLKDMLQTNELNGLINCCKKLGLSSFVESSFCFPEEGDFSVLNSRSLFSLQENKNYRDFVSHTVPRNNINTIVASSLDTPLAVRLALSQNAGCIVGSALMQKQNTADIIEFINESKGKNLLVKVCGAKTRHDLKLALMSGAEFIGINLIPSSKRFIGKTNLLNLLPELEKFQQHICFITREDASVELISLISHLHSYEQAYSVPLLPCRRGLFLAQNVHYIGMSALILEGDEPRNDKTFNYPVNKGTLTIPTFIGGELTYENIFSRKTEAEELLWNCVGVDCAAAVCFNDLNTNLNMNVNSFSKEKIENLMNVLKIRTESTNGLDSLSKITNSKHKWPDENQKYSETQENQTQYITPLLEKALTNLNEGLLSYIHDKKSQENLKILLQDFCGRETPLTQATNLGKLYGGTIFLKREDLVHGGAHKLNNAIAQCALAEYMGFKNIIAETGAGQHGVATAMAGAKLKLNVQVYQGQVDIERQQSNVLRMKLFGANLIPVTTGDMKLNEAVNAAWRAWVYSYKNHAYCIGSIIGPHPFPNMVRHFQKIIGEETKEQILEKTNGLPAAIFACVGGGSNAAGIFTPFVNDFLVNLIACEAEGAASLCHGEWGILHGMETLILQTPERQIASTHSISAGLDYPFVGPWLAGLKQDQRLQSLSVNDAECITALKELAQEEGILCALESAHAIAGAKRYLSQNPGKTVVVCISGRGDKDLDSIWNYRRKSKL